MGFHTQQVSITLIGEGLRWNRFQEKRYTVIIVTWDIVFQQVLIKINNGIYTVSISKAAANSSDLILSNFNNIGGSTAYYVKSSLSGSSISIPSQDVLGDQISGSGSIAADTKINFTYTVYDPNGTTDAYAAIYTK